MLGMALKSTFPSAEFVQSSLNLDKMKSYNILWQLVGRNKILMNINKEYMKLVR